jgi:acyl transferase domain-containing protein/NAD(P)H-dependent flavin oxidoreductase YrpB (nitropropane dioxygenase family)/NAD(P)-dependent dehydrogenase (short-subunit alcohol dehydrogenase family)
MRDDFRIFALTPAGFLGPALAIAASRAGEIGIFDLSYLQTSVDDPALRRALARFWQHAHPQQAAVKLHATRRDLLAHLLAHDPSALYAIILVGDEAAQLMEPVATVRAAGVRVLLEVTSRAEAQIGLDLQVDGLIAKGNEAAGRVGEETTFILLQALQTITSVPVYAQGGIGLHTVAACSIAGAAGVVLDSQLLLTRESSLPAALKERLARMDGSETLVLGGELGAPYRLFAEPAAPALAELRRLAAAQPAPAQWSAWREAIAARCGWDDDPRQARLIGQDIAFAAGLARPGATVAEAIQRLHAARDAHLQTSASLEILGADAPLARAHGTRYPLVQGPMTRVSDTAAFALAVAQGGALPFVALALMRAGQVSLLLEEVKTQLGDRPWGVGILGFVPHALRQEQLAVIREVRPPYALIAGGRPDQAAALEQDGIPTYLHVPSPGLLQMFLADGAHRFIFEGRECGGHVGPRSSFVLWNTMVDVLVEYLHSANRPGSDYQILFAGGIHDGLSAAMVSALAAPLAALGVKIGLLMGTAYLFTQEAVTAGAITARYQQEAQRSSGTVLVETGPGHVTRCLSTPFVAAFNARKRELLATGADPEQIRNELENLNLGRLRMASKGLNRNAVQADQPDAPRYFRLDEEEQYAQGMYMIGQVAALRDQVCTVEELHQRLVRDGAEHLAAAMVQAAVQPAPEAGAAKPSRIAIVGMACLLPGAPDLARYWENILAKVDAITEIPVERFDWRLYYDPDRHAPDKIYSRWGGFIDEIPFNPMDYGMPPNSLPAIEPMQLLMLEVVRAALADAGYLDRPFPRATTSVIMAVGGGLGDRGFQYAFRSYLAHFLAATPELESALKAQLPTWTEDSFPGMLLNVLAGRVANRFDLGGPNLVVDAACGSSLAALDIAVKDLELGRTDMALVGAADTVQSPFGFMSFSKTQALSPTGRCRPFDVAADGIAISEGLAVIVLKRLDDAVRDGDSIYAVIQGVGSSSDGRDRSLTAPRPAGQLSALRRAYAKAGIAPSSVGLFEAHGTGTRLGDVVEIEALETLLQPYDLPAASVAVGSVKSMIGHTKSTAGLAGLIKVALGLYHKLLPPTLVDTPNPKVTGQDGPIYVNDAPRPWLTTPDQPVRRAGVSAFGFGGANFHAVLEEYTGAYLPPRQHRQRWPAELLLFAAADSGQLLAQVDDLAHWLEIGSRPPLRDLAHTLYRRYRRHTLDAGDSPWITLALTAATLDEVQEKLAQSRDRIAAGAATLRDPRGIYFAADPLARRGALAFLYPGQGSQHPNMLAGLITAFPGLGDFVECANHLLADLPAPLSRVLFPKPAFTSAETEAAQAALTDTRLAQPALGAVGVAATALLARFGVRPQMAAGHSYGELVALWSAGVLETDDLIAISAARGRVMADAAGPNAGTMAAIQAGDDQVAELIRAYPGVTLANVNAPTQTVISGPVEAVAEVVGRCEAQGIRARRLPVACAFHSPLVAGAQTAFAQVLEPKRFAPAQFPIFANSTGEPYPTDPGAMRGLLAGHLAQPVFFQSEVEAMYAAGARIFIEAGPRRVLSNLVAQILGDRPHIAVPLAPSEDDLPALLKALGQLAAEGVPLTLDPYFDGCAGTILNFSALYRDPVQAKLNAATWLVNGGRVRPWRDVRPGEPPAAPPRVPADLPQAAPQPMPPVYDPPAPQPETLVIPPVALPPAADRLPQPAVPDQVMLRYQQLMSRFLSIHVGVLHDYFQPTPTARALPAAQPPATGAAYPAAAPTEEDAAAPPIYRYLVTPQAQPPVAALYPRPKDRALLIVDDGQGVAAALAATLHAQGYTPVLLTRAAGCATQTSMPAYPVDLADRAALAAQLATIRGRHGSVGSVFYLSAPAAPAAQLAQWQSAWQAQLIGLLHLLQAVQDDLSDAPAQGAAVLATTYLGGDFGPGLDHAAAAIQGGIGGLLKTFAHELPGCRVKVVDLAPDLPVASQVQAVVQEWATADGMVEAGYTAAGRRTLQVMPAPVATGQPALTLDRDAVILITGGARGITAQVAEALARRYQPKLILAGRSPLPEPEGEETAALTGMAEIKAALVARITQAGQVVRLADVEHAYRHLMAGRELRANLTALQATGATVYYHAVDVRDEAAFGQLLDVVYAQFGRLDGVIHGAGILEDKLLADKEAASLQRVISTKIDSAFLLSRHLRPETLRFLVFFSSVSGRFGNKGQGDYAAANEVLNKLAHLLDRQLPSRVVAINWGPWAGSGMVTDELRRQFAARGVDLIPPAVGCQALLDELCYGRKGEVEVLFGGASIHSMSNPHLTSPPEPATASRPI